jgi:hypothetical protein
VRNQSKEKKNDRGRETAQPQNCCSCQTVRQERQKNGEKREKDTPFPQNAQPQPQPQPKRADQPTQESRKKERDQKQGKRRNDPNAIQSTVRDREPKEREPSFCTDHNQTIERDIPDEPLIIRPKRERERERERRDTQLSIVDGIVVGRTPHHTTPHHTTPHHTTPHHTTPHHTTPHHTTPHRTPFVPAGALTPSFGAVRQ